MYCLDTNVIIGILNARVPHLINRHKKELFLNTHISISMMVLFELRYGAEKSLHPARNHARINDYLLAISEILDFDTDDAAEAGKIRCFLEAKGTSIGAYDVLIAAQARRRGATLVTLNLREFERIPGLLVTDWTT